MKYISKSANLMVVLRNGLPGNTQLGTASIPGLYVRFKDGIVDIEDPKTVELMELSPSFNVDFVKVAEDAPDPYASNRVESEPKHTIKEIKYGYVDKMIVDKAPAKASPELQKYIQEVATSMAKEMALGMVKEMLPGMVQETLKSLQSAVVAEKEKPKSVKKKEKQPEVKQVDG